MACDNKIVEKFLLWKTFSGHENIFAKDVEIPIEELLGLSDISVLGEIKKNKKYFLENNDYLPSEPISWQFLENSYSDVCEAHLQGIVLWAYRDFFELNGISIDLKKPFPVLIRIIKSIQVSPYTIKEKDCFYIIIPTYFFRIIDHFIDSYEQLAEMGSKININNYDNYILTNFIGGQSIEIAINNNFKKAVQYLENFKGIVGGLETFHDLFGIDFDFEKGGFPIYFPDYIRLVAMLIVSRLNKNSITLHTLLKWSHDLQYHVPAIDLTKYGNASAHLYYAQYQYVA